MSALFAIGIDLGGTNLKGGVVGADGRLHAKRAVALGDDKTPAAVCAQIAALVRELASLTPTPINAVGCGVPGIVDAAAGMVYRSPNLPAWNDVPVRALLAQETGLPILIDNDANMHALGEARCGAGRDLQHMVFLTLGSGIGGGLLLDGVIYRGERGFAGEVGHLVVEPNGAPCGCGGRGCWELYAASRAFATFLPLLSAQERGGLLAATGGNAADLTPALMARLADEGNSVAHEMWARYGRYLGIGIATLLNTLGVMTFVIGGGIARSFDRFAAAARTAALEHTYPFHAPHLSIRRATLGEEAGMVGAALEALRVNLP